MGSANGPCKKSNLILGHPSGLGEWSGEDFETISSSTCGPGQKPSKQGFIYIRKVYGSEIAQLVRYWSCKLNNPGSNFSE